MSIAIISLIYSSLEKCLLRIYFRKAGRIEMEMFKIPLE
jgi:hypothetical protein